MFEIYANKKSYEFIQDWTYNNRSSSASSTSRLFISSKYAPLTNITPTQAYLQQSFVYRPSWENTSMGKSANKKSKYGNSGSSKGGISLSKSKSKSKHRNAASTAVASSTAHKSDGKSKRSAVGFGYTRKDAGESMSGPHNKYDNRSVHIKEEQISDAEIRNESESDTDSDTDKKKSSKKSHEKSSSKKLDKKSRKSDKSSGQIDELYDNNANSDDNSNDSGQNFGHLKSESYHKANVKTEPSGTNDNVIQRDDAEGQTTNNTNLDKSSSSVEEFDNEKPTKVVKVNISLDYDSEVYNEEMNIRKFHKYQRNIEMANSLQVAPFDTATESFPFETNASTMLDSSQQLGYSSSDSDSDDSDANDLDDSDNSSCDECSAGPCSASVLPPLLNGSPASSPAMSMSSYYNKNGESQFFLILFLFVENLAGIVVFFDKFFLAHFLELKAFKNMTSTHLFY